MVDVFVRNLDAEVYARLKADAARRKLTVAEEIEFAFERLCIGGGTTRDLLKIAPYTGKVRYKDASSRVDELVEEEVNDDYRRLQRHRRKTH